MQDITDLGFWRLMARYGGADVYYTEYFRVHPDSHLDKPILASITQNPTGRPVVAQMIGNDIPSLVLTARELQQHPIVAVDLNLGCPAPVVCRKDAGGGLLRQPERVDEMLRALRETAPGIDLALTPWRGGAAERAALIEGSSDLAVTLTAGASEYVDGSATVTVRDDDLPQLILFLASSTVSTGTAAPMVKASAEAIAACTGRARRISVMPSSSRAWACSASCEVSCTAT